MVIYKHHSLIGSSHIENQIPCEDSSKSVSSKYCTVLCISDGCGSKENSHLASKLITDKLTKFTHENFTKLYENRHLSHLLYKKFLHSIEKYIPPSLSGLYGTIRLVAVFHKRRYKPKFISISVGDGCSLLFRKNKPHLINKPPTHWFVNETEYPLSSRDYKLTIEQGTLSRGDGFLIMTDGCERLYNYHDNLIAKYNEKLFSHISEINLEERLLELRDTTTDDLSLGLIKLV